MENAFEKYTAFKPSKPLDLRTATAATIFWAGGGRTWLYLTQSQSKTALSSNVDVINPLKGKSQSKDVEKLARKVGEESDQVEDMVDSNSVQQIIQVCFDESGSMEFNLEGYRIENNQEFHRVTIAAQYLTTFANRLFAYRVPCLQGLITFGQQLRVRSALSPLVPDFEDGIKQAVPVGTTPLWDCLRKARTDLVLMNTDAVTKKAKFPNTKLRILVISDGEDTASESQPEEVVTELIDSNIIVDAVILNSNDTCKLLCAVCHLTGGLAFRPDSIDDGLALFEQEAFLNSVKRPVVAFRKQTVTAELLSNLRDNAEFDKSISNSDLEIARARTPVSTAREIIFKNSQPVTESRTVRLLREIRWAAAIQDPNVQAVDAVGETVRIFDEDLRIYPFAEDLGQWRVFLRGPLDTPYAGKWWYLTVTFPQTYPEEPPVFRFVSVPFHLNVSSEGRICLNLIERGYVQSALVFEMIQFVKQLFLIPDEESPIQISKLALFRENRDEYDRLARESCRTEAKNSPEEFMTGITVSDEVPADFQLEQVTFVQQCERSPFTGEPIPKDKQIRASSGLIYHVDELKQYVSSTVNPRCVITGKLLTETFADFA
jgi:ubiquitin-protein ligase/Mg-chelatase subunit ChlD